MVNKKKYIIVSVIVLILFSISFFILRTFSRSTANQPQSANNSSTNYVLARSDKPFYIEIPASPSTGHQWQADFDSKILKLINSDFQQKKKVNTNDTEVVQVFEFQPLVKENTTINFKYVRPWEENASPTDTKTYQVTIQ